MKLQILLKKLDLLLEAKAGKLTSRNKLLICLGVWLLPSALFILLFLMPQLEESGRLQQRLSALDGELNRLQVVAARIDQHREEMAEVEERLRLASKLLPEEREIPTLLTTISNLGTDSGLDFLLFRPRQEIRQDFYAEIPVEIAVRGSYHNVGVFLDRVSKLPRVVTINNLNMGSPSREAETMLLNTTFTLLTYRFVEPEPEPE